jgi:hypothetical protein
MANAKTIAIKVLRGIGKGLYYFFKGLWIITKAIGNGINRAIEKMRPREKSRKKEDNTMLRSNGKITMQGEATQEVWLPLKNKKEQDNRTSAECRAS